MRNGGKLMINQHLILMIARILDFKLSILVPSFAL